MKKRKTKKILKQNTRRILNKFEKYFTLENVKIDIYYQWGCCVFEIKEQPHIKIGINNIALFNNKNKKDVIFFTAPKYSPDKFSPIYCKEHNTVRGTDNIDNFIYVIFQCCNDLLEMMRYPEETEDEFWETYYTKKHDIENYKLSGLDSDEYRDAHIAVREFLNNEIDYSKIPLFLIRLGREYFRSIGSVYFYPDWNKCDSEYANKINNKLEFDLKLSSFGWRSLNVQKLKKRKRKEWLVYTKEGVKSLYKFLKR